MKGRTKTKAESKLHDDLRENSIAIKTNSIVGLKFGRLAVLEDLGMLLTGASRQRHVIARCECGNIKQFRYSHVKSGGTKSCGCLKGRIGELIEHIDSSDKSKCIGWNTGMGDNYYGAITYKGKQDRIHRIVCRYFHGEPLGANNQAAHSCGNSKCINPNHIRWATVKENHADKAGHGTHICGEKSKNATISEPQAVKIIKCASDGLTKAQSEKKLGFKITDKCFYGIRSGNTWKHLR